MGGDLPVPRKLLKNLLKLADFFWMMVGA